MAKKAPVLTIFSFFACFWLLTALVPLYGAGSREGDLSAADQLIADKEYDQAILFLTNYARRNPDQFDQAQARLNKIYLLREEFNKTADLLIKNLLSDEPDDEVTLAYTTKLRSLENDNSPILVEFLARIHEIALFNVSRTQLRRALENGREMLDRENFEGALNAYAAGFTIMRDEFYSANYGAAIHNQTRQETERINGIIASFRQTSNQLESITTELTRAVNSGQHQRAQEIMTRLVPAMDRFIAEKQNVIAATAVFERHLQSLQSANPAMGDRNHLAFLIRVIYGRNDQDIQEGILGAFDGLWKKSAGGSLDAITQYVENTNNSGLNLFNRRNFSGAASTLAGVAAYSGVYPVFFEKYRQLTQVTAPLTVVFNGTTIQSGSLPQYLKLVSLYEACTSLEQVAEIPVRNTYDNSALTNLRARKISAPEALEIEQRTRNILFSQLSEIETVKTRAQQTDTQISAHQNYPYIKTALSAIDALFNTISTEEQQSIQRYYNIAQADLEHTVAERKAELDRARAHMEGDKPSPALALREITPMLAAANEDIIHGNTLITQIRDEPGITSNTEIRTLSNRYQASVNELTGIRNQGQELATAAGGRAAQADALRREGERLFYEAQTAFQRQDYDTAIDRIGRSSSRLDESLAMADSEEVRNFRDTQVLALNRQIAMSQSEIIIVEVRNLVNSARDLYFAGNFQRAEEALLRARNRWRIIDPEENAEVVYWLSMVERAMGANTVRVIPPTAPLYPEISQLLSQARRNYEEGIRLYNAGQTDAGKAKFDEARVQTREVKLMFPVNQEAGVLELRMDQFTDPRAFNAAFEQRLRTAQAEVRQRRSLESYADILNLAEINPGYPGIRNIITQAEIDMGLRPPPPDPAAVARSNELTAAARSILEQRLINQYEIAIAQINEAITLNPLNRDAPRIKDQLLNMSNTNQPSLHVLNTEDEALYQQAFRDHQAGNNLVAYANIELILQNPSNRNVAKVLELQRRIRQALGI